MRKIFIILMILIFILSVIISIFFISQKRNIQITGNNSASITGTAKVELFVESKKEKTINVVILGDGFTASDISNGIYNREIQKIVSKLLGTPPFQQFIKYINVYIVYSISRDSGADDAPGKDTKDTIFNCTYGKYGIQRLLVVQDYPEVKRYVEMATSDAHVVIVLVNDDRYGGSGGYYSVASINKSVYWVVMHEIGHSFGGLADEYEDAHAAKTYSIDGAKHAFNVDLVADKNKVKWRHLIGLKGYDLVGVYEGAYYRSKGVYRSQEYCIMRHLGYPYCHVCRELSTKRAFSIIGENYSFKEFLKHDPVTDGNKANFISERYNSYGEKIKAYDFDNGTVTEYTNDKKEPQTGKRNDTVYLYEHVNYKGYEVTLTPGIYSLTKLEQSGMKNNDVSSIIIPDGYEVILYENDNFTGSIWVYYTSIPDFTKENNNDKISSLIIKKIE